MEAYANEQVDEVYLIYARFVNALRQIPTVSRLLPVETPDRPAVVPNLPTTSRSTAPYIACRTSEPNIGNMNFTSFFRILPEVKLLSFIQYIPVICHLLMYRVNGFNHTDDLLFRYILQYPAYIFIEPGDIERIPCPALFA